MGHLPRNADLTYLPCEDNIVSGNTLAQSLSAEESTSRSLQSCQKQPLLMKITLISASYSAKQFISFICVTCQLPQHNTACFKTFWQPRLWCSEALVRVFVSNSWAKHLTFTLHCDFFNHQGIYFYIIGTNKLVKVWWPHG